MTGRLSDIARRFFRSARGAILVETLIVVPVIVVFAVGVVEFGAIFLQRLEMQAGVRDAARYWSRCIEENSCSVQTAENIAFYGVPVPVGTTGCTGTAELRVPNWCRRTTEADPDIDFIPDDAYENAVRSIPGATADDPSTIPKVKVRGRLVYQGSPVFRLLSNDEVSIAEPILFYEYEQRHIGW